MLIPELLLEFQNSGIQGLMSLDHQDLAAGLSVPLFVHLATQYPDTTQISLYLPDRLAQYVATHR